MLASSRSFRVGSRLKDRSPSSTPHAVIMNVYFLQPWKSYTVPTLPHHLRSLSWWVCGNKSTREVVLSPSLEILSIRLDNILNNLIRPHCWTYFEQEIAMKTSSGPFHCHLSCHPLVILTPGQEGRHLEGNGCSSQEQGITIRPSANRVSKVHVVY